MYPAPPVTKMVGFTGDTAFFLRDFLLYLWAPRSGCTDECMTKEPYLD